MFVYLVIAIELVILYLVFWIIFLRQPRPIEIQAELWGGYQKQDNQWQPFRPDNQAEADERKNPAVQSYRSSKKTRRRHRHYLIRRASRTHLCLLPCSCTCHDTSPYEQGSNCHQVKMKPVNVQKASRKVVEKFLYSLNQALNKLSVKLP